MDAINSYASQPATSRSTYPLQSTRASFKLDEGFSEDARSQDENGQSISAATVIGFQQWVMAQDEATRSDIAYEILRTLRTSNIAGVVERLTPLLHMDPVEKLPPEITESIFASLDAPTLLTASLSSRTWRERILDPRLWRSLYLGQGWGLDENEISRFEAAHANLVRQEFRLAKSHGRSLVSRSGQPQHKKRATSSVFGERERRISGDLRGMAGDTPTWRKQHDIVEADSDGFEVIDHEMEDVSNMQDVVPISPSRPNKRHSQDSGDEMDIYPTIRNAPGFVHSALPRELYPPLVPSLLLQDGSGNERLNWSYLYKQRRRLEENWNNGRYTNFQLPHPLYPQEAHTECVYTIQFFGKWLVSGSRDQTLRVWDLETRRLRGKPLVGHSQSVLCLQFDPTEKEDVIISGSSDTSIIVWRFSTGQKIQEIPQAHRESVLNLRFDHRYLVTCSKDKLIKVWNRQELAPTDADYPRVNPLSQAKMPSYIVDVSTMCPIELESKMAKQQIKTLKPYSLLMILDGHGAAVNAIQIDKDEIVSASGDRMIKIWNAADGRLVRTITGHQKGIACVQFDSKRIVSGSSDNTVRIYDPTTGAEVATLVGHQNLVRTVQAGFGDAPGDLDDLQAQALEAERAYAEGIRMGTIIEESNHRRRRVSRRSQADSSNLLMSIGAALPPGGGGSQWGRIVSGSYDESIIIWKKNANGAWVSGQVLRQDAAVRASNDTAVRASHDAARRSQQNGQATAAGRSAGAVAAAGAAHMPGPSAAQIAQQPAGSSMTSVQSGIPNVMGLHRTLQPNSAWASRPAGPSTLAAGTNWLAPGVQQAIHQLSAHAQNVSNATLLQALQGSHQAQNAAQDYAAQTQLLQDHPTPLGRAVQGGHAPATDAGYAVVSPSQEPQSPPPTEQLGSARVPRTVRRTVQIANAPLSRSQDDVSQAHGSGGVISSQAQQQPTTAQPVQQAQTAPHVQQQPHAPAPANGQQPQPPPHPLQATQQAQQQSVSRVFKLQFDSRRLVCCSQVPTIVGWDFAAGDPDIIEASKFFSGP